MTIGTRSDEMGLDHDDDEPDAKGWNRLVHDTVERSTAAGLSAVLYIVAGGEMSGRWLSRSRDTITGPT